MKKIVIIGSGGRESAIANKIHADNPNAQIIAIPGNAGILTQIKGSECVPLAATDVCGVVGYCSAAKPDLVVVAADDPLAAGMVDALEKAGIRASGATQRAAEVEWSKVFSKGFMKRHNVPTAQHRVFDECELALDYVKEAKHPIVIKANGLALGKGVVIAQNLDESVVAIKSMMCDMKFGGSGEKIVIEEFLTGPEITLMAFVDGKNYALMPTSQDYKRALDGDKGLNTGGMGAVSPAPAWSPALQAEVVKSIVQPTIAGMLEEARPFKGILYFGLMATPDGVKVIEYNSRFGDPEAQTILPLLETNIVDIFNACIDGTLDKMNIRWKNQSSLCVVIASGDYPGDVKKGLPITIGDLNPAVTLVHCGTKQSPEGLVTNGGRVFNITTTANSVEDARKMIYAEIDKVKFAGARYRRDIGK
jgi:phosphoribosylamine--glycine ligase